jgi:beta-galactosidase
MKLKQPMLWSTQTPNMYRLRTRIMVAGKVVDQTLQKFGIRTLKFDANKGFFLNGTSMKSKGYASTTCRVLGAAVPAK